MTGSHHLLRADGGTQAQLPVRSINRALRASHDRLVSDVLVQGDPDYPFPEEDYLEFVLLRLENVLGRERERETWTVPEESEEEEGGVELDMQASSQAGLGDFA